MEGSLVSKTDLQALYLSGTYCHKTGTRPTSCAKPQQPTICVTKVPYENSTKLMLIFFLINNV